MEAGSQDYHFFGNISNGQNATALGIVVPQPIYQANEHIVNAQAVLFPNKLYLKDAINDTRRENAQYEDRPETSVVGRGTFTLRLSVSLVCHLRQH